MCLFFVVELVQDQKVERTFRFCILTFAPSTSGMDFVGEEVDWSGYTLCISLRIQQSDWAIYQACSGRRMDRDTKLQQFPKRRANTKPSQVYLCVPILVLAEERRNAGPSFSSLRSHVTKAMSCSVNLKPSIAKPGKKSAETFASSNARSKPVGDSKRTFHYFVLVIQTIRILPTVLVIIHYPTSIRA